MEEQPEKERMSLTNIRSGAIVEAFDRCLVEVLDNINDINTNLSKRAITLKVTIKPLEDRTTFVAGFNCESKLQGHEPVNFSADLKVDPDKKHGYAIERGRIEKQEPLPFKPKLAGGKSQ